MIPLGVWAPELPEAVRPAFRAAVDLATATLGLSWRLLDSPAEEAVILLVSGDASERELGALAAGGAVIVRCPLDLALYRVSTSGAMETPWLAPPLLVGTPSLWAGTPLFGSSVELGTQESPYTLAADVEGRPVATTGPVGSGALGQLAADLIGNVFGHAARFEERVRPCRDAHGRFPGAASGVTGASALARGAATVPAVGSRALMLFLTVLIETARAARRPFARLASWPGAAPMAVGLTHDVDRVRKWTLGRIVREAAHGSLPLGPLVRGRNADPYWTFETMLDREREAGVRATFFLGAVRRHRLDPSYALASPPMRRLVADLGDAGHEVGLHYSYDAWLGGPPLAEDLAAFEAAVRDRPEGARGHYLRIVPDRTFRALADAGLRYDATLGFHDRPGYRAGLAHPFTTYDSERATPLPLLELPLALMDTTLWGYAHLDRDGSLAALEAVLTEARAVEGLAMLLIHQNVLDATDFPIGPPLYEAALAACGEAYAVPAKEIAAWWRARQGIGLEYSVPFDGGMTVGLKVQEAIEGLAIHVHPPPGVEFADVGGASVIAGNSDRWIARLSPLAAGSRAVVTFRWAQR